MNSLPTELSGELTSRIAAASKPMLTPKIPASSPQNGPAHFGAGEDCECGARGSTSEPLNSGVTFSAVDDVVDALDEILGAKGLTDVASDVEVVKIGLDPTTATGRNYHDLDPRRRRVFANSVGDIQTGQLGHHNIE